MGDGQVGGKESPGFSTSVPQDFGGPAPIGWSWPQEHDFLPVSFQPGHVQKVGS